jgi:hypothetical protein
MASRHADLIPFLIAAVLWLAPGFALAMAQEEPCEPSDDSVVSVPELDAAAAEASLALLIGGALVLVERRRRTV